MLCELLDHLKRDRRDVRSDQSTIYDMHRMADRRRKHFGAVAVVAIDLDDILDQLHSVLSDIVESPNERRNIRRPGLCRKQSLCG